MSGRSQSTHGYTAQPARCARLLAAPSRQSGTAGMPSKWCACGTDGGSVPQAPSSQSCMTSLTFCRPTSGTLRLVRRFGRDETMIAFAFADHVCEQWREFRQHDEEFRRRMHIFHGTDWEVPAAHPTIAAAAYPQVVALARLLVTPYWRFLATDFSNTEHPLFVRELHGTVAPGLDWPQPSFSKDPLHRWLIGGLRRTALDR